MNGRVQPLIRSPAIRCSRFANANRALGGKESLGVLETSEKTDGYSVVDGSDDAPGLADERRIFLIHHPDLLSELKLENKGVENSGLHYFSFNEIEPALDEIQKQGQRVNGSNPSSANPSKNRS